MKIKKLLASVLLWLIPSVSMAAFPQIAAKDTSYVSTDATSHTVRLPSGITSGNLLIVFFTTDANPTVSGWPSGWTAFWNNGQAAVRSEGRYKISDGTETNFTLTTSTSENSAHQSFRITGHRSINPIGPGSAPTSGGTSAAPDPPNCTPGIGEDDFLWFEAFGADDDDATATYWSTNYTGQNQVESDASNASCMLSVATRELNAASENPGAMAMNLSEEWGATTFAIIPQDNTCPLGPETGVTTVIGQWTNTQFLKTSDNNYAVEGTVNDTCTIYDMGIVLPTGATVDGITVELEAQLVENPIQGGSTTGDVDVKLSWNAGTSFTTSKTRIWTEGEGEFYKSYGGASDTWGRSWSASDLADGNFRAVLKYSREDITQDEIRVDHVRVTVHCTEAGGGNRRREIILKSGG